MSKSDIKRTRVAFSCHNPHSLSTPTRRAESSSTPQQQQQSIYKLVSSSVKHHSHFHTPVFTFSYKTEFFFFCFQFSKIINNKMFFLFVCLNAFTRGRLVSEHAGIGIVLQWRICHSIYISLQKSIQSGFYWPLVDWHVRFRARVCCWQNPPAICLSLSLFRRGFLHRYTRPAL